jgi:hypothetical protein
VKDKDIGVSDFTECRWYGRGEREKTINVRGISMSTVDRGEYHVKSTIARMKASSILTFPARLM